MADTAVATALPYFRTVKRDAVVERISEHVSLAQEKDVVQQRFLIIRNAGSTKESSFHVWLDVQHEMFAHIESPGEVKARESIEQLYAEGALSISLR